jgi:CHAD domain-containing protein
LRDLDVFGEVLSAEARDGVRVEALAAASDALNSERWSALREALEVVRHPKRSTAKKNLRQLERRMEKLGSALHDQDGEELHRLRRTLRRVRYAREWLGLNTSELATQQESLGAVCDLLALQAFAVRYGAEVPSQLVDGIVRGFELIASQG